MEEGVHGHVLAQGIVQLDIVRRLVGGAFVVILVTINGIEPMTDLARQFRGSMAEEAVVGVTFRVYAWPWAGIAQAPLMDVMTGGTGDGSGVDLLAGNRIEEGKKRAVVAG